MLNCCRLTTTYEETTSSSITTSQTTTEIELQNEFIDIQIRSAILAILKHQNYIAAGNEFGVGIYDLRNKQLVRTLNDSVVYCVEPFKENKLIQTSSD